MIGMRRLATAAWVTLACVSAVMVLWLVAGIGLELIRAMREPEPETRVLVRNLPQHFLALKNETEVFQLGRAVGQLNSEIAIYPQSSDKPTAHVRLYAWVWRESLALLDGDRTAFKVEENVRRSADGVVLGRFEQNAIATLLYENPKRSWALVRLDVDVDSNRLEQPRVGFFVSTHTAPTIVTTEAGSTRSVSGLVSAFTEVSLVAFMLVFMFLTTSAATAAREYFSRRKKS